MNSGAPRDVNVTANGHFVPIGVCLTNREDTETFEFLFKCPEVGLETEDCEIRNSAFHVPRFDY